MTEGSPGLPGVIAFGRVRLILITPDEATQMLAGSRQDRWHPDYPGVDDVNVVASVGRGVGRGRPDGDPWGPRHIVVDRLAVGTIGFHAPPEEGEVEVGFALVPAVRGAGLTREALGALLEETDRLGVGVRAATAPDDRGRLRVLAGCGFTELRGGNEDGDLVMARPVREAGAT